MILRRILDYSSVFFQDAAVKLDGDPNVVCLTLTVVEFFRDIMLAGGNAIGDLSTLK